MSLIAAKDSRLPARSAGGKEASRAEVRRLIRADISVHCNCASSHIRFVCRGCGVAMHRCAAPRLACFGCTARRRRAGCGGGVARRGSAGRGAVWRGGAWRGVAQRGVAQWGGAGRGGGYGAHTICGVPSVPPPPIPAAPALSTETGDRVAVVTRDGHLSSD